MCWTPDGSRSAWLCLRCALRSWRTRPAGWGILRCRESHHLQHAFRISRGHLGVSAQRGRIGTASAFLGTLLNIKPILTIKDGIVQPLHKIRSKAEAKRRMVEVLAERVPAGSAVWAGVTHAQNLSDAQWMEEQLRDSTAVSASSPSKWARWSAPMGGRGTIGAAVSLFPPAHRVFPDEKRNQLGDEGL